MKKANWLRMLLSCLLIVCTLLLCACPGGEPPIEPPNPPSGGDDNVIYEDGAPIAGAGDTIEDGAAVLTPAIYDEEAAQDAPASNLLRAIASKFAAGAVFRATNERCAASADNKDYDAYGTVILAPHGIRFSECRNVTIKNMVIIGSLTVEDSESLTFQNVEVVGDVTVASDATDVTFLSCRLTGENTLTIKGKNVGVADSYIGYTACGVKDESPAGTILVGNRVEGIGTAISSSATGASYTYNTVKVAETDTALALTGVTNTVAGMNVIRGAQTSVTVHSAYNTAVVSNSLISVTAEENHAVYICDNQMGGRLTAKHNNYLLADGNAYPEDGKSHAAILSENENTNGNTLMDVDARLEVGADEDLLPHTDKDLFLGMERQTTVRALGEDAGLSLYRYMMKKAQGGRAVILTPGVYTVNETAAFTALHNGATLYAYGVYAEGADSGTTTYQHTMISVTGAQDIAFKGITVGYAHPTCGQVYVLEKRSASQVRVVTAAGMWEEFSRSDPYGRMNTTAIGIYRAGEFHSIGYYGMTGEAITRANDGTMIITLREDVYDMVHPGDVLVCYLAGGTIGVTVQQSANIRFMDMVYYAMGSNPVFEMNNTAPTTYYRVHNTTKGAPLLTEDEYAFYERLENKYGVDLEISQDTQKRYRGAAARIGSTDANHIRACVKGSQVISCIWENLVDDGGNQHSFHSRLGGYVEDGDEIILLYKNNLSENSYATSSNRAKLNFQQSCSHFRAGDRVYIYTAGGQLVCDTTALTAAWAYDTISSNHPDPLLCGRALTRYAVRVKRVDVHLDALAGYDLSSDTHVSEEKVVVDNRSLASEGFLYDNVLSQNTRTRGVLAKAGGTIKNCTFRNCDKIGIGAVTELYWGESGMVDGLIIKNNIIDNTSYVSDGGANYRNIPIVIQGLVGESLDEEHLLYQNIEIVGNKFVNRNLTNTPYAIHIKGARDVLIEGNDFGCADATDEGSAGKLLLLESAMNIELKNNTYSPLLVNNFDLYVEGEHYKNIFGSDVCDINGNSFIIDKP